MKRLTVVLLLLISFPVAASHIVGGEIELLHKKDFTYRLNLIYYFDVINSLTPLPENFEPTITLYVYRKSDNMMVGTFDLEFVQRKRVPYTAPDCSSNELITDKVLYGEDIQLPAELYSDPGGYYIIWPRCCRNYTIVNIFSQNPDHGGTAAGQTFYLEFPPVTVNGQRFINSSPKNFPALADYACPTKPYYVDFAGVDDDGDSLAYSLVTPLSTTSATAYPGPSPAPYPDVLWKPEFDQGHAINKSPALSDYPDLSISNEGFLRVRPRTESLGLYVFAVKVEEFRNKTKIGETRRDFQMLVTDCRISAPPLISGKAVGALEFTEDEISVQFDNSVGDNNRYITVSVSDTDAKRVQDDFTEKIKLKVIPLGFKKDVSGIKLTPTQGEIHNDGTFESKIFFPACPFFLGAPYKIGIIAFDDACALPLSDTLKVKVQVEPPDNERVKFNPPDIVNATLNEGQQNTWQFEAHDADGDEIILIPFVPGFSMAQSGMSTTTVSNTGGILKGEFKWDTACDRFDFTRRTGFTVRLLADDLDQCNVNDPDTLTYNLNVILPGDNEPFVDTDLTPDPFEVEIDGIEKKIFEKWTFNVTGTDIADNDLVTVQMVGDGFNPADFGMSFDKVSAIGTAKSAFTWDLQCKKFDLAVRDSFNIAFLAIDSTGKCRVRNVDSLVVKVKIRPPNNAPPGLSIVNLNNDIEFDGENYIVWPGQKLDLQLNVSDADVAPVDSLGLRMIDVGGDETPEGWEFEDVGGPSILSSLLSWAPECSIFKDNIFEHDFYFEFRYSDNRCLVPKSDSVRVNVKVKDRESGSFAMDPANVFTPNGDGINDYYSMERRDESGDLVNILPPDNCQGVFETIKIYNRWGSAVFTSTDRNFRWLGLEEAAGVYFYHVVFSNRDFKGTVSLRD